MTEAFEALVERLREATDHIVALEAALRRFGDPDIHAFYIDGVRYCRYCDWPANNDTEPLTHDPDGCPYVWAQGLLTKGVIVVQE